MSGGAERHHVTAAGSLIGRGQQPGVQDDQSGPWRPLAPPPGQSVNCQPSAAESV